MCLLLLSLVVVAAVMNNFGFVVAVFSCYCSLLVPLVLVVVVVMVIHLIVVVDRC